MRVTNAAPTRSRTSVADNQFWLAKRHPRKGKPVARRGRKAMGPGKESRGVATLPKGWSSRQASYRPDRLSRQAFGPVAFDAKPCDGGDRGCRESYEEACSKLPEIPVRRGRPNHSRICGDARLHHHCLRGNRCSVGSVHIQLIQPSRRSLELRLAMLSSTRGDAGSGAIGIRFGFSKGGRGNA